MICSIVHIRSESSGLYLLTLSLDEEYLSAKSRAYPVIIDPTFTYEFDASKVYDTYISAKSPDTTYWSAVHSGEPLKVGYSDAYGACRSIVTFGGFIDFIKLSHIINAKFTITGSGSAAPL